MQAEAVLRTDSQAPLEEVRIAAETWLRTLSRIPSASGPLSRPEGESSYLDAHAQSICLVDVEQAAGNGPSRPFFLPWEVEWDVRAYALNTEGPEDGDDGPEDTPSFRQWALPSAGFHGLWESLHYDTEVKRRLLRYSDSALLFAEKGVNPHLVSCGRVVLLHGPPGTGKTSLCQALAQKLSIRMNRVYATAELVEVNAHSLFSRWFSESGKLVASLFEAIFEKLEDKDALVFVLVDEVESLAASRAASAGEPSDAVRAVNALLTQLDQLRTYRNCMVLTTSNITGAIDVAFVDRADIKAYIGPPTVKARYEMLRSSVEELIKVGIVDAPGSSTTTCTTDPLSQDSVRLPGFEEAQQAQQVLQMARIKLEQTEQERMSIGDSKTLKPMQVDGEQDPSHGTHVAREEQNPNFPPKATPAVHSAFDNAGINNVGVQNDNNLGFMDNEEVLAAGAALLQVAQMADGLSGRTLRKLPFLAHAGAGFAGDCRCTLQKFLNAMSVALQEERNDRESLVQG